MSHEKIFMLNALWFKPDGGAQRYQQYLKAINPLVRKVGGRKLKSFVPGRAVIGQFDADLIFFMEYPNWQAFKDFANSAAYHKVAYLREEAITNSLLIRCDRPEAAFSEGASANYSKSQDA